MTLAHITLATRDIEATRKFLETALGWRSVHRPNNIPMRAAWLAVSPEVECHLIEVADYAPSPFEREYGRHVALAYPLAEFPALKERLARLGAEIFSADRPTPFQRFFFRDPNGYIFEIVDAGRKPETE